MVSNNVEEKIRNNLKSRKLKPSKDAWLKLEERLDHGRSSGTRRKLVLTFAGIAASLTGLLFLGNLMFQNKKDVPVIVDTPLEIETNIMNHEEALDATEIVSIPEPSEGLSNEVLSKVEVVETPLEEFVHPESIASNKKVETIPNEKKNEIAAFEEVKVQEVLAQVHDLKMNNQEVTDSIVDALLLEAQNEIRLQRITKSSSAIVDADLLLHEVELELDESFRTKVFKAIKESYGTIKTAVAQRND
ncbi:hypothetical protein [Gaetbulibacter saemankumensis]|uniref:hypothetical protein n=1 Tax=Gaetbulibacter saemankumensis TaxID=311208 RepID=UPI0003FFCAF6|nr:hypothetical protein [Gaetbulibacter saemankumensis]